jgi:hypothetical protein
MMLNVFFIVQAKNETGVRSIKDYGGERLCDSALQSRMAKRLDSPFAKNNESQTDHSSDVLSFVLGRVICHVF